MKSSMVLEHGHLWLTSAEWACSSSFEEQDAVIEFGQVTPFLSAQVSMKLSVPVNEEMSYARSVTCWRCLKMDAKASDWTGLRRCLKPE